MTKGIYGAFNKTTGECIYVGKSNSSITGRWNHHKKLWKAGRPIHRQPLLTQYLYFFGDQVEWRILSELSELKPADWIYTDHQMDFTKVHERRSEYVYPMLESRLPCF